MNNKKYVFCLSTLISFSFTVAFVFAKCDGTCVASREAPIAILAYLFLIINVLVVLGGFCFGNKVLRALTALWGILYCIVMIFRALTLAPFFAIILGACIVSGFLMIWMPFPDETVSLIRRVLMGLAVMIIMGLSGLGISALNLTPELPTANKNTAATGIIAGRLNVLSLNGDEVALDLKQKPAVLISTWCEGCDDTLKMINGIIRSKRPYVIGTYIDKTRVGDEKKKLEEKVNKFAPGSEAFLLLDPPPLKGVPGFLYVPKEGDVMAADTAETVRGMLVLWDQFMSEEHKLGDDNITVR